MIQREYFLLPKCIFIKEFSITLIPKPDRHYKKRKLQTNNSYECKCKNPEQNTSKLCPTIFKKNDTPRTKWDLSDVCKTGSTFKSELMQSITSAGEKGTHISISIDAEKSFDKIKNYSW